MSNSVWLVVDKVWCDRMKSEADLLEERVFPDAALLDANTPFQVRARKCSFGMACNLIGFKCQYAMNNPNYDPFAA